MIIFVLYYIFFFLFHNKIFINSQFYSINSNDNFSLSEEIKKITDYFPYLQNNQTISTHYLSDSIKFVNKEINYNIDLPKLNDELGIVNYNIHDVFFNGENFSSVYDFSEYFYENSFEAKKIEVSSKKINKKTNRKINENFYIKKFSSEFKYGKHFFFVDNNRKNFSISFKKILNVKTISFGLGFDNNLYQINDNLTDDEDVFLLNKKDECLNNNRSIENFFVSNSYLILFNNIKKLICVFNVNFSIFDEEFFLDDENEIQKFNFNIENSNNKIIQIKIKFNIVYILFENSNSIITYNLNQSEFGLNFTIFNNIIIDFIINSETIYAIIKNTGIVVFNISNGDIIKEIPLSSAISIDRFINPFNGKLFFGIFLNYSNSDEFFIELYAKNETNVFLNKVLIYRDDLHYNFSNYISFDGFFSYFFDNANGNIIVIRRGLMSGISFYSYFRNVKEVLKEENLGSYKIIPFHSKNRFRGLMPFLWSENKYLSFKDFIYVNNELNITFYKEGMYTLMISHVSNACNENVNNYNNSEIYCLDLLSIRFKVFGKENNHHTILIVCIFGGIIFFFIIPGFITIFIIKMKDKEFSLKVKSKVDKNNKENLYKKHNEYNNKRNNKIETKQFDYNLFLDDEDLKKNNFNEIKEQHQPQISASDNAFTNYIDNSFNNNNNKKINIKNNIYKNIMIKDKKKTNFLNNNEIESENSYNLRFDSEKNNILIMKSNRNNNSENNDNIQTDRK